jgi:hypothetical protein
MFITIGLIGGGIIIGYIYRNNIMWNTIKLYTYINKSYINKDKDNIKTQKKDLIIDDIIYIEYKGKDLTNELLINIKNQELKIKDDIIEVNNKKFNINDVSIVNINGDIITFKEYFEI